MADWAATIARQLAEWEEAHTRAIGERDAARAMVNDLRVGLDKKTRELWAKGVELEHSEAALTEARAEIERLRAAASALLDTLDRHATASFGETEDALRELTTPPAPASPVLDTSLMTPEGRATWEAAPLAEPAPASPRLCPGCRSLDGEHSFGPTCTLAEPSPAESREDGGPCSCRLLFGERIWGDCDDGRCKGSAYVGGVP